MTVRAKNTIGKLALIFGCLAMGLIAVWFGTEYFNNYMMRSEYLGVGTRIIGLIVLCAVFGFVLTRSKRAPAVAATLNVGVVVASGYFLMSQVYYDVTSVRPLIAETHAAMDVIEGLNGQLPPNNPVTDTDLIPIIPILDELRDLPFGRDTRFFPRLGFLDGIAFQLANWNVYTDMLSKQFLPRIQLQLENIIINEPADSDLIYEAFKAYLMIGNAVPSHDSFVKSFMMTYWEQLYPDKELEPVREGLFDHLLRTNLRGGSLDPELVDRTRQALGQLPLAQRIYRSILTGPAAADLTPFRLTDAGGPNVARVFVRASGAPLDASVPGIYTYDGFYKVFVPGVLDRSPSYLDDAYVYGPEVQSDLAERSIDDIMAEVFELYYADYIAAYDNLLGDIDIIPVTDLKQTVEVTNLLSGGDSPILNILAAVAKETRLTDLPQAPVFNELREEPFRNDSLSADIELILSATRHPAFDDSTMTGRPVEAHFVWLQDLVAVTRNEGSQVEAFVDQLQDVNQDLSLVVSNDISIPSGNMTAFQQSAESYGDTPLNRWVRQIANSMSQTSDTNTRAMLNAIWQAEVLPLCQAATAFNYPFQRDSAFDIPINDFNELFAPGGLIDDFFNTHLADRVDRAPGGWTQRPGTSDDYVISATVLRQMQNAAQIRDAFFPNGGSGTSFEFGLTIEALDPKAQGVTLDTGLSNLTYAHGGAVDTVSWRWPPSFGEFATLRMSPELKGVTNAISFEGPWSLFRLMQAADWRRTNEESLNRLIFRVDERLVIFRLETKSVLNPFTLPALSAFECPQSL